MELPCELIKIHKLWPPLGCLCKILGALVIGQGLVQYDSLFALNMHYILIYLAVKEACRAFWTAHA